jgi:hypothetical protein
MNKKKNISFSDDTIFRADDAPQSTKLLKRIRVRIQDMQDYQLARGIKILTKKGLKPSNIIMFYMFKLLSEKPMDKITLLETFAKEPFQELELLVDTIIIIDSYPPMRIPCIRETYKNNILFNKYTREWFNFLINVL